MPRPQMGEIGRGLPHALILAPTRELCLQIADDLRDFSKYLEGVHIEAVYGGASIEQQIRALRKGVQVIVATLRQIDRFDEPWGCQVRRCV